MGQMIRWALEPAEDDMLLSLVDKGKRDARAWALSHGIPSLGVVANKAQGSGVFLP